MMKEYRLSKYDPAFRNQNGAYTKDEWISYCDIGTVYDGVVFTKEEYLRVETTFIDVILQVLSSLGATTFQIRKLELPFTVKKKQQLLEPYGLSMSPLEKMILSSLQEGQSVSTSEMEAYLRLFLRECFWCELHTPGSEVVLYPGDDYFMHLRCESLDNNIIHICKEQGFYIEDLNDVVGSFYISEETEIIMRTGHNPAKVQKLGQKKKNSS